ncbi:MAG TPA: hypothetical protein EYG21_05540 [Nitrospinaceae bacterium]|jgi:hypothetical protein|nr:hypothetical protein [Nitrospinaceae bacterium]
MKQVLRELVLGGCTFYIIMKYKKGDIVVVRSPAGEGIPSIHVKLLNRIKVAPHKGNSMDWPGYSGWEATPIYQEEIDILRKQWSIPLKKPGKDLTFVYDRDIIRKEKEK